MLEHGPVGTGCSCVVSAKGLNAFIFWSFSNLDAPDGRHDAMDCHDLWVITRLHEAREDRDTPDSLLASSKAKAESSGVSSTMFESSMVSPVGGVQSKKGMKSLPSVITGVANSQQSPQA